MSRKDISDEMVIWAYLASIGRDVHSNRWKLERPSIWPTEILMRWTGEPEKVCYRAMERADDRGLIDYGVSLRAGWPTPEGMKLLHENDSHNQEGE